MRPDRPAQMTSTPTRTQVVLAQLALATVVVFVALGLMRNGFSPDVRERLLQSVIDRPGGPMTFRFILQPLMATAMAAIDGARDARSGASPYVVKLLTHPERGGNLLFEGVISTARIILLGLGMDVIYQAIVFGTFYPGEAALIAVLLAFVPYLLLRGPFARLARWHLGDAPAEKGKR
jgi:hypothetical protein